MTTIIKRTNAMTTRTKIKGGAPLDTAALKTIADRAGSLLETGERTGDTVAEYEARATAAREKAEAAAAALSEAEASAALGEGADVAAAETTQREAMREAERAERAVAALRERLDAHNDGIPERAEAIKREWGKARMAAMAPLVDDYRRAAATFDAARGRLAAALRASVLNAHLPDTDLIAAARAPDPETGRALLSPVDEVPAAAEAETRALSELREPVRRLQMHARDTRLERERRERVERQREAMEPGPRVVKARMT